METPKNMQQVKEQTKRMNGTFVRNISQQFGSIMPEKSNCKCEAKDLDHLKDVHLVSSRRQFFEERTHSTSSRSSHQQQNDEESESAKNELKRDLNAIAMRRRSKRSPKMERKSRAFDDHLQNNDDHNNNVLGIDQENVEKYRGYVIKKNVDDFNETKVYTYDDTEGDNEDAWRMKNCEEVVKEISEDTRSLHSLTLSLSFMQSLLGIGKQRRENDFDNAKDEPDEEYQPEPPEFKMEGNDNNSDSSSECNFKSIQVLTNGESDFDVDSAKSRKKQRPRISRFNRLSSLKKQKRTIINVEEQSDDEDDIFGSMIGNNDYFLEVINADSGVVLNKISLQRVCISNILINQAQNSKGNHITSTNDLTEEQQSNDKSSERINITTTVYYDQNSNPRIEKIIDENKLHVAMNEENLAPPLSPTLPNRRQNLIIKELLETEVTFIDGLRIVIEDYMAYFQQHPDPKYSNPSSLLFLFGNVEEMYAEARKFHADLLSCDFNLEKIASTFLEHENLFEVFVTYIKNKPASQLFSLGLFMGLIKERHTQLQEKGRLDLNSYLLTPVQRLGRYILFMENLQKVTKAMNVPCAVLNEATDFLKREMRRADTFVAAVMIGNSPVDLTRKGSFVAKETFNIKKKYKSVVFLFQDIVVFTVPNPHQSESYFYKDSIEMFDLTIRNNQELPLTFNLRSFSKSRNYEESPNSFELDASSENVKRKWVQMIENLLWEQLEKCKAEALSGKTVYRKFKSASTSKRRKQPESSPPTPSETSGRQSVFYVEC